MKLEVLTKLSEKYIVIINCNISETDDCKYTILGVLNLFVYRLPLAK